jgi:hypothetical protein
MIDRSELISGHLGLPRDGEEDYPAQTFFLN